MTDKRSKTEEYEGGLQSIAALLVALAVLAERAAIASAPVRCLVLWLLRPAEAVAWNFVVEEVFGDDVSAEAGHVSIRTGNSRQDAALLSTSFRALADAVERLAREEELFERRLARWERKTERDVAELTLDNRRGSGPAPIAHVGRLDLDASAQLTERGLARLSAFAPALVRPVALIDTS